MERTKHNSINQELKVTAVLTKSNQILVRIDLPIQKRISRKLKNKIKEKVPTLHNNTVSIIQSAVMANPIRISRKSPIIDKNKKYQPLAKQLYDIVSSNKNIRYNLQSIKTWANEIRILSEKNGIGYDRIECVLDWYEDNIGGEYIPIVESGHSLRSKFLRLEAAMMRKDWDKPPMDACPNGWIFGQDFQEGKQGCRICESRRPELYRRCELLHLKKFGDD